MYREVRLYDKFVCENGKKHMKRVIVVLLFSINILVVFGQVTNEDDLKVVKNFIGYIQRHDIDALCSAIEFPFQREYPNT